MNIHSVKLINYKSIGDYDESEVLLEPRITTLIGKNESGKSNVIEGLAQIQLTKNNDSAFVDDNINRNSETGTELYFVVNLKASSEEKAIGINEDTQIILKKGQYIATGGIVELYKTTVADSINKVIEFLNEIGSNPFQLSGQDYLNYQSQQTELANNDSLNMPKIGSILTSWNAKRSKIEKEKQEEFQKILLVAQTEWIKFVKRLPIFFYRRTDKHLKSSYKSDEVENELNNPISSNSLLSELVKIIGVQQEDFITAVRPGTNRKQLTLRDRINEKIQTYVNEEFQQFYHTEKIRLAAQFNNGSIYFSIRSDDGGALMLSERSEGLRWYLETFIDVKANDMADSNVVYLFDEPGISLHVNAQKELRKLFNHLVDKGNQIVYTTHSPYMLDIEGDGIQRIRAIVKDVQGYTRIYKTAYDYRINPDGQKDTLAPLISALGMNLNDTFGPAKDKLNIVTEGMSDYIYIFMMASILGIDKEKYVFVPSVGASNCQNICSILHGWGCKYIALFDYDKQGVETGGEYMRKNMFYENGKQYCYIYDATQEEIDERTYNSKPVMIENIVTQAEIDKFCEYAKISNTLNKALIAKLLSNAVSKGEYMVGEECKSNFKELFKRILA